VTLVLNFLSRVLKDVKSITEIHHHCADNGTLLGLSRPILNFHCSTERQSKEIGLMRQNETQEKTDGRGKEAKGIRITKECEKTVCERQF